MNNTTLFFKTHTIGMAVCAVLLGALTGCVGYVQGPGPEADVAPAIVVQDDYVYYPNYGVYYSSGRHQYAYQENGGWVNAPAPRGVSVNVLLASPSVKMNFHDAPANHHAAVVKQYPKNWKPSASQPGQNESQKDDRHDDHGQNNGR